MGLLVAARGAARCFVEFLKIECNSYVTLTHHLPTLTSFFASLGKNFEMFIFEQTTIAVRAIIKNHRYTLALRAYHNSRAAFGAIVSLKYFGSMAVSSNCSSFLNTSEPNS